MRKYCDTEYPGNFHSCWAECRDPSQIYRISEEAVVAELHVYNSTVLGPLSVDTFCNCMLRLGGQNRSISTFSTVGQSLIQEPSTFYGSMSEILFIRL